MGHDLIYLHVLKLEMMPAIIDEPNAPSCEVVSSYISYVVDF